MVPKVTNIIFVERRYQVFSTIQTLVDWTYMELVTQKDLLPKDENLWNMTYSPWTQKMPYPEYKETLVQFFIGFMAFFASLSFTFIIPPIMKRIVQEKKSGAKELMKMMGLPNWMAWLFHYLDAVLSIMISIVIIVILLCIEWVEGDGRVIEFSNPFLIFLFFLLYSMALIAFLFSISTLFNNPNLALTAGIVIHLIGYFLVSGLIPNEKYVDMDPSLKILIAFIYPNAGFWFADIILMRLENSGSGLQVENLFQRSLPDDPITMGVIWIMFIVNILTFAALTWYIDTIKPGPYGVAQKWYFLFSPSYWRASSAENDFPPPADKELDDYFEGEPVNERAGVIVNGLRKVFKGLKSEVLAVDSVSFKAYHGQITALLGHNGAGKTTTMNMLTGMLAPSYGSALIDGHSVEKEMSIIRKSLGLCPQHNMLFIDMTVEEHLKFFGMLKG